jgi:hypothetical protein
MVDSSDRHGEQQAQQRLQKVLRGAFAGPPTQLKDIPKKTGESRAVKRAKVLPSQGGKHAAKDNHS